MKPVYLYLYVYVCVYVYMYKRERKCVCVFGCSLYISAPMHLLQWNLTW
jgi:hypothetical protein